jgi:hypothetical protein
MGRNEVSTLETPLLRRQTTISELIASLTTPDHALGAGHPGRLTVHGNWPRWQSDEDEIILSPLPPDLTNWEEISDHLGNRRRALTPSDEELHEWLSAYPSLSTLPAYSRAWCNPLAFEGPASQLQLHLRWPTKTFPSASDFVPFVDLWSWPSYDSTPGLVLPALGGNIGPQHPFLTWFILMFALSMLARYHPQHWRILVNFDTSKYAVPIHQLLGESSTQAIAFLERALSALR